jgi:hypothetical protein
MEENLQKYHKPRASKGAPIPLEPPGQSFRPGTRPKAFQASGLESVW